MGTVILADIVDEAARIMQQVSANGVSARLIGGLAVRVHVAGALHPALARPYADIDLATHRKAGRPTLALLQSLGYVPNERFNAMNGGTRLLVYDLEHERQIDVFVGEFRMCHRVPLTRLDIDPQTIPLAELLLTKLQIVELNRKDVNDILAILLDHDVGAGDEEMVNSERIAELLSGDWGLWRTTQGSLRVIREQLSLTALDLHQRQQIEDRLSRMWERVQGAPKSLRWRTRAQVGDRARWYEEPEEVQRLNDV